MNKKNTVFRMGVAALTSATLLLTPAAAFAEDNGTLPATGAARDAQGDALSVSGLNLALNWLDLNDEDKWSGIPLKTGQELYGWTNANNFSGNRLDPRTLFPQVGSIFTDEIVPGFEVKAEVVELKPYAVDGENYGFIDKKPAGVGIVSKTGAPGTYTDGEFPDGRPIADSDNWGLKFAKLYQSGVKVDSRLKGYSTKDEENGGKTGTTKGVNVGIKFKITATLNGYPIKPTVFAADTEEAGAGEYLHFTTTGTPWNLVAEVREDNQWTGASYLEKNVAPGKSGNYYSSAGAKYVADELKGEGNKKDALDVGPFYTKLKQSSTPILSTTSSDATNGVEVGLYSFSDGSQDFSLGVLAFDQGDAPASYKAAKHYLGGEENGPFIGTEKPDFDPEEIITGPDYTDWDGDDKTVTVQPDEGVTQFTDNIVDAAYIHGYTTYTLPVKASPGELAKAQMRAWVDFNNNGVFDDNEKSDLVTVDADNKTYSLTFAVDPTTVPEKVDWLGARIRIAGEGNDLPTPDGEATTGEVEDVRIRVISEPTGEAGSTTGFQGQTQTFNATVRAHGIIADSDPGDPHDVDGKAPNTIKAGSYSLVAADGTLTNTVTHKGEGTYVIDPTTGRVTFTPDPSFTGTAQGVSIRATDANGKTTAWSDGTNHDGRYTPNVVGQVIPTNDSSVGPQGKPQTGTPTFTHSDPDKTPVTISADNPAKLIDPATGKSTDENSVPALKDGKEVGTYTIDPLTGTVTFQPNPDFVGTPDPARVVVYSDKDSNVFAVANYTPSVYPALSSTNDESVGPQGKPQTGTPTFNHTDPDKTPVTISADNPAKLIDPATGKTTEATSLPALKDGKEVGTYTIDPSTGTVTFQPNPDFVGTPDPAIVSVTDQHGQSVTARYQPQVLPVVPVGENATDVDFVNKVQTGTPKFFSGDDPLTHDVNESQAPDAQIIPSADNPAKLIDPQTLLPADSDQVDAVDETGKKVGVYTINPTTGEVTFTPNDGWVGQPLPAAVVLKDANGTPATAYFQPRVLPLPVVNHATSIGPKGKAQTGTPTFNNADEQNTPIRPSDDNPAKLIDPATGKSTDENSVPALKDGKEVGTYTIDPLMGTVTFQPNPDFVGTPDPAIVEILNEYDMPIRATYTPTVTPDVVCENAFSTGVQGAKQEGQPVCSYDDPNGTPVTISADNPAKLIDPATGKTTDENSVPALKDGKEVGTYTIDPLTGTVTFEPNPDFVGTPDPAIVSVTDQHGQSVTATYTPTVTPHSPKFDNDTPKSSSNSNPVSSLPVTGAGVTGAVALAVIMLAGGALIVARSRRDAS